PTKLTLEINNSDWSKLMHDTYAPLMIESVDWRSFPLPEVVLKAPQQRFDMIVREDASYTPRLWKKGATVAWACPVELLTPFACAEKLTEMDTPCIGAINAINYDNPEKLIRDPA